MPKRTNNHRPREVLTIAGIVREMVGIYGSKRKFAKDLGVSESRVGKLVIDGQDNLTFYNVLLLAYLAKKDPYQVLKAAKKEKEADLLRKLAPALVPLTGTGKKGVPNMTASEALLAKKIHAMPSRIREVLHDLVTNDGD